MLGDLFFKVEIITHLKAIWGEKDWIGGGKKSICENSNLGINFGPLGVSFIFCSILGHLS